LTRVRPFFQRAVQPVAVSAIASALVVLSALAPPPEVGEALVATDHVLASEAGADVLRKGGNAVDAAVAAALSAGVVQPAGSGLGGGGFAIVVQPDGTQHVLDFREVAPAGASRDMFRTADGQVDGRASRVGGKAVGVPGESRGLARLLEVHGSLDPSEVAEPAIRQAREGFEVHAHLSKALAGTKHPMVQALFAVGDRIATDGDEVKRPALARTLERWAATAGEDLYTGEGSASVVATVEGDGGPLSGKDLAAYEPKDRLPIVVAYKDFTLVTMPPPSSGGVVLGQALQVLEGYDLPALGHNSSDYLHLLAEVMKHGYADRAHHLGDPDFVDVPVERLLSEARRDAIRKKVWPGRTFPPEHYGPLIAPPTDGGTQHISVIDRNGMAVALTTTINTSFGSGLVAKDAGIVLNNEMDDFAAAPGVPNAFGLVGNEANAVEPGKRPLSSMTPTVVLNGDGEVVMAIGASGGSFIISSVLQTFLNVVEFDMDPQQAVSVARIHHQWQPDQLFVEGEIPRDVRTALEARGHTLRDIERFSSVQVVYRPDDGPLQGGADPSKGGWPARK
jgi:gamma-glutamyltranspeptidase/glutathione hydrolase